MQDPQRIHFDPKALLSSILSVYLNLSTRPEFISAIAADQRSYRRSSFDKARSLCARFGLKAPDEIDSLLALADAVDKKVAEAAEEDEDLGEIPDEYADPLMATVMRNPVRLPTSGAVLDLSTIKAHLLSDASDPFNRAPLKLDQVKVDEELKAEIEKWIQERKEAAKRG